MRILVLTTCLFLVCFAACAQRLSGPEMIQLAKKHSLYTADTNIKALNYAYPPTHKDGIFPVIYDLVNWDSKALKFPNRYEVTQWKSTTDSSFAITFVTSDTVQFNALIAEFTANKFVRTAYGEKSINKDYTSVKYPNIVMRISYNELLNMGPNKIGVHYSWR